MGQCRVVAPSSHNIPDYHVPLLATMQFHVANYVRYYDWHALVFVRSSWQHRPHDLDCLMLDYLFAARHWQGYLGCVQLVAHHVQRPMFLH